MSPAQKIMRGAAKIREPVAAGGVAVSGGLVRVMSSGCSLQVLAYFTGEQEEAHLYQSWKGNVSGQRGGEGGLRISECCLL